MNSTTASPAMAAASDGAKNPARTALTVGVIGLAIAIFGLFNGFSNNDPRPILGYLLGFAAWYSMAIGMLLLVMLFYLFDAGWPIVIRRQLEHALAAFPILALCFVPLLLMAMGVFGQHAQGVLWTWLDPQHNDVLGKMPSEPIAEDPLFQNKAGYLSMGFFVVRLCIYFGFFIGISHVLRKNSFAMDTAPDAAKVITCRKISGLGIYAVPMALTFSAFDFFMSLTYHWFSTMYGVWFFATSMRAGIAGTIVMCYFLSNKPGRPLYGFYRQPHQYLLGCLALTFTIFWAYVTFSQYFLIYNADIPEETFWFNLRELNNDWTQNSWWWVGLGLIFGYFFLPFFALLSYHNKVRRSTLLGIALWVLSFHLLDLYFNILPGMVKANNALGYVVRGFRPSIWDLASWVGVGGLCIWAFLRSQSKIEQPIPIHDPRIQESLNYHE